LLSPRRQIGLIIVDAKGEWAGSGTVRQKRFYPAWEPAAKYEQAIRVHVDNLKRQKRNLDQFKFFLS